MTSREPSIGKLIIEVEEKGKRKKIEVDEEQICWEGYRKVRGKLIRGVPKRNRRDCFRYCRQPGCEL